MKKSAEDLAVDVLGQEAKERKRRERWISTLTAATMGSLSNLAMRSTSWKNLPIDAAMAGIAGLTAASLPYALYKDPVKDADDPRWWRPDYSPTEHGLALGVGAGAGSVAGSALLRALQSKGIFAATRQKPFKGLAGSVATLALPSIAGYFGARQLMRMRDARRDAAAQSDLDVQIPNSPAAI